MNVWGCNIKLTLFGESHGPAIGAVLDGLPPGFNVDWEEVSREMSRRAPGGELATSRAEADRYELLSGIFEGVTTASPICAVIRNENTRSGDYTPEIPRPGHADYTSFVKYKGFGDYRGGGRFSGRLTAPLVWAGAIAKQILRKRHGIKIAAHIVAVHGVRAEGDAVRNEVLTAKENGDSVGGVIECEARGVPPGVGEPFFASLESEIAALLFSVPAVKGVEFGDGFRMAEMLGSEANDPMSMDGDKVVFATNHNGGILGGISTGQPIIVRAAIKPTPSIAQPQTTVNLQTGQTVTYSIKGRHDPCIVPRAVPVIESCVALCLLDALMSLINEEEKV